MNSLDDYIDTNGKTFYSYKRRGYISVPVLSNLIGTHYTEITLGYIQGLNPTTLRVTTGECTANSVIGRITVIIDNQKIIQSITKEISVGLPEGIQHGVHLEMAAKKDQSLEEASLEYVDTKFGCYYTPYIPKNIS